MNDLNRRYEEVLQTYGGDDKVINTYTYGIDRINSIGQDNETYLYDGRGSVVGSIENDIISSYAYTAYGSLMPSSPVPNVFGYNGEATDFGSGIQYLRARYYDSTINRFFQEDDYKGDFVEPQTMNRYIYVGGNPVNRIDPSGYLWGVLGGVLAGLASIISAPVVAVIAVVVVVLVVVAVVDSKLRKTTGQSLGEKMVDDFVRMGETLREGVEYIRPNLTLLKGPNSPKPDKDPDPIQVPFIPRVYFDNDPEEEPKTEPEPGQRPEPNPTPRPPENPTDEEGDEECLPEEVPEDDKENNKDKRSINGIPVGTLSDIEARKWYYEKVNNIPNQLDKTKSLEEQAKEAHRLRNLYRTQTRELMENTEKVEKLNKTDPNMTWEQTIKKYQDRGYEGADLWREIIGSSQRSNSSVNEQYGVD